MSTEWKRLLCATLLSVIASNASAQVFSGRLDDESNTALVANDLRAARFDDDDEVANNVAIYDLTVLAAETFTFTSTGFSSGGVDPYFTLFEGSGDAATFLASNYDQAFSTGGDFAFSTALTAGNYRLAIGAFASLSFAENYGSGTLADGFVGLGQPGSLGDASYGLTVTRGTLPVPEPSTWLLMSSSLMVVGWRLRQRARDPVTAS